ncbi:MAG TPA: hypothetical protein VIY73_13885 [Polyangiaceae bacterium]
MTGEGMDVPLTDDGASVADDAGALDAARRQDDLVLLTTPAIRARRHPRAIAGMWAWEAVLALLVGWPAAGLAHAAWSGDAHGDAPLWAPGGHALADWLWRDQHALASLSHEVVLVLIVGAAAGLVPMAALLVALAYATRDRLPPGFARCMAAGFRAFRPMIVLLALATLLQALTLGVGALVAGGVEHGTHGWLGEARAQQLEALVFLVFLVAASLLGVAHDLGRAAVVRFKVGGIRGFALGARTLRLYPVSTWWSWAWRALASLAPILAVAAVAGRIGGEGGVALVFLFVMHQAVVAARVALRASWLARALRAVDAALRRAL